MAPEIKTTERKILQMQQMSKTLCNSCVALFLMDLSALPAVTGLYLAFNIDKSSSQQDGSFSTTPSQLNITVPDRL